jgi:hypothetical protein
MAYLQHQHTNGNGHMPPPQSKRAFHRSLPGRLGGLEDQVDVHDQRVDEILARLSALEAQPKQRIEVVSTEFFRSLVEDILRIALGKRSARRRAQQPAGGKQSTLNL